MQYGVYLFFAGCVIVMTLWVAVWLPETRGVPVEHVMAAWATCAQPRLLAPPCWQLTERVHAAPHHPHAVTLSAPACCPAGCLPGSGGRRPGTPALPRSCPPRSTAPRASTPLRRAGGRSLLQTLPCSCRRTALCNAPSRLPRSTRDILGSVLWRACLAGDYQIMLWRACSKAERF